MTIADKLTLLASSKEALRVKLGLPKSLPFSEYYKHSYPFDPLTLFAGGKQGVWYDPSDKSTLFQDVAGTVPVTKDGDPVALMRDKSGNGNHATQTVSTARPIYKTDGVLHWLRFDGVDDNLFGFMPSLAQPFIIASAITIIARVGAYDFIIDGSVADSHSFVSTRESGVDKIRMRSGYSSIFSSNSPKTNGLANILLGVFNTDNSSISLNGVKTTGAIGARSSDGITIGSTGSKTLPSNINFYGLTALNDGSLIVNTQENIKNYLAKKSGVTL